MSESSALNPAAGSSIATTRQEGFVARMETRGVRPEHAFFVSHLKPGMRLLDCGCGPGSVTIGLAEVVSPAEVIGFDIDPNMIERARAAATAAEVKNVSFEVGDVYGLPYPDASFDAVWSQLMLMHVPDPLGALKEMRRVLRPGGVVGIRDADTAGEFMVPETSLWREAEDLVRRVREHTGGSPGYARQQRALLLEAGFSRPEQTAGAMSWGSEAALQHILPTAEARFRGYARVAVAQGWLSEAHVEEIVEDMRQLYSRPDAFLFHADLSAVAFVDS